MTTNPISPVYFDCDTGVDDSVALGYLLASPEVDLVGIGTVSGNTDAARAAVNSLDLLALAGRPNVPVAVGATNWLARPFNGGVPHIHGANGVGNVDLPPAQVSPVAESAADLLVRLSREHAGRLRIIAVGPLTNLALALSRDPSLAGRIASVTVMGGAAMVPGNISAVAEANIGNDPEAARQVVTAGWPVTLVPLDVTQQNTLDDADRARLLSAPGPLPRVLGQILDHYFDFHVPVFGRRGCPLHDPLAAALAVGVIKPTNAPAVEIEVDATPGPGRGQTLCDLRGQNLGPVDQPGRVTRVVLATSEPLGPHLIGRLSGA
ncbi:MAG: nucleoside hydrolase [Bifidobacteriaceae bacterium]|jgi:purine nucleosidase|nr:nucleoside hydrolase [Bifidobacteriaceae bacterium]